VADRVLLRRGELGHRAVVVGVVGDEDRVVAEAAAAAALAEEEAFAVRLEDVLGAVLFDQGEDADVGGATLAAGGVDFADQLVEVVVVARPGAGVAGGVDAGGAVEVVGLDPGRRGRRGRRAP